MVLARAELAVLHEVGELYRACDRDRLGVAVTSDDEIRFHWLEGDLDDTLLVRDAASGDLLAYEEFFEDATDDELDLFFDGRVHPAATGRGVATFLLGRALERATRAAHRRGRADVPVRTVVSNVDDRARAFFARHGFVPVRFFLRMSLDLAASPPVAQWPEGVSVRPATPADDRRIHELHERAFADHPTHEPVTPSDFQHARLRHGDRSLWRLAEHGDELVGICLSHGGTSDAPTAGHVRDLAVAPAWRGRGIGLALLRTALGAFRDRGLTSADLDVDDVTLDGAVRLYERAGLQVVRRTDVLERRVTA